MNAAAIAAALGDARGDSRAWRCRCPLHGRRSLLSKNPPAEPGALVMWPLEAAVGAADAAP